jgi:hypothetical protein
MKAIENAIEEREAASAFAIEEAEYLAGFAVVKPERDTFSEEDMEKFLIETLDMEPVSAPLQRGHFKPILPRLKLDYIESPLFVGGDEINDARY